MTRSVSPPGTDATGGRAHAGELDSILKPRSIAVIGASRSPETIGHQIVANLVAHGFTGAVHPVNPKAASIHSIRAYPSVRAIGEPVDLAIIAVPKERVLEVSRECVEAGVKGLVVISAGFREVGGEGVERENALRDLVRRHGVRMVGPNCMGVLNTDPAISMNGTFAPTMPPRGRVGFVSQSGAMGLSVLDYAKEYGIGISQFVSVGNKADVSGNDLLTQWEHDPTVDVILMYVENFGNPRRFLDIASRLTKRKPLVILKSGRSTVGARAATSHTGALAASEAAVDALLSQAGVLRAGSVEELFDIAMVFTGQALPRSRRTAVVTNAGGPGILAADALEGHGLVLGELSADTVRTLTPLFPPEASIRNPLDMIASATPTGYRQSLEALLGDARVDSVLAIFVPPLGVRQEDVAEAIVAASKSRPDKPVVAVLMGKQGLPQGRAELNEAGIPGYIFPESAARALAALARQSEWVARPTTTAQRLPVDRARAIVIIERARSEGRAKLSEIEVLELLAAYGIPVAEAGLARDAHEAARIASTLGYPLVLKVVSPDITHKTDIGGVKLGIETEDELREAYRALVDDVRGALANVRIDGVLVQRMVRGGTETIVGVSREPLFGPLVMFGLGGIFVEALRDIVFRVAPLTELDARDMITSIRAKAVLEGIRGRPPADRAALERTLRVIAQLADDFPEIEEMDINPLLALPQGVLALDARVRLRLGSET
ncbi:MAG TPA: acetate--CoA ligase family protein [Gemmatimonadaceae bacterium]|nr:acetate--CoA ligase family protein [Gemmatimonadaceae bacterium]